MGVRTHRAAVAGSVVRLDEMQEIMACENGKVRVLHAYYGTGVHHISFLSRPSPFYPPIGGTIPPSDSLAADTMP